MRSVLAFALIVGALAALTPREKEILSKSKREDVGGWIKLSVQGSPYECGFQHGYNVAAEFQQAWNTYNDLTYVSMGMPMSFFNEEAVKIFYKVIPEVLIQEMQGIADGINKALGGSSNYTLNDIIGWNAYTEMTGYWWPTVMSQYAAVPQRSFAGAHCSAFIATGSATIDGSVHIGHETFTEFWNGQYMNLWINIQPSNGYNVAFQGTPGYVSSMTDFWIASSGLAVVETTIVGFVGFNVKGIPEWVRIREATQFASSITEWVAIMQKGNNGGYANSWLIGDLNSGEIARFEQGLTYTNFTSINDGYLWGCNVPFDPRIRNLECVDVGAYDIRQQTGARSVRWPQLLKQYDGVINVTVGQTMLGDTWDPYLKEFNPSSRGICAHYDVDPQYYVSDPNAVWNVPFTPAGSVDGKVTNAALGLNMSASIIFGRADGAAFDAASFLEANPQWNWQAPYLQSRAAQQWVTV